MSGPPHSPSARVEWKLAFSCLYFSLVMHGSYLALCRVALAPSTVDGGAVLSKLPLWSAQGRALGALVEVLDHWRLCVVLCAIALPQLHLRGA